MQVQTENGIYYVAAIPLEKSKLPEKVAGILQKNSQHEKNMPQLMGNLLNAVHYAVGCSDARYPGIPEMPNSFMAGSRNDANPEDYRISNKPLTRIQVDHHNGSGGACGGRANAQNNLDGKVFDPLYQQLAMGVSPDSRQNAIQGAGNNGIAMVYNHLTGEFEVIQGSYEFPQELKGLPAIITKNLEKGTHNGRTNFANEQDPNYLVFNLALGTLGQYLGSELSKPLGESFEVKPWALGISLLVYEPKVVDVASLMYSLDSRLQTLKGIPHGFKSMDTFIILYLNLTKNQEQTSELLQGLLEKMIKTGPRLGEHLTNELHGISVYALGVNKNGLILPENVYALNVVKQ